MRKNRFIPLLLVFILSLSGCGTGETDTSSSSAASGLQAITDISDLFTDRDFEIGYDESESALIQLNGSSAQCDAGAVKISGSIITITDEGTYILTGNLQNGMVIVEAEDTDKLQIVLNGASISNESSAALYIRQADKVFITTANNTENTLSNGGTYTAIDSSNIDAALFSKADLTLNGAGTLQINAEAGHGVVSKDDLVITSGAYKITAANHGLSGKDSVRIANGSFTIQSGKDGIQAENDEDSSLGFLYLAGGSFQITSGGDGLSAGNELQIEEGSYTLLTGGGSNNAQVNASYADSTSMKGIKAAGNLAVTGGAFTIDSADDALHSNANLSIGGGSFQISTGDDGLHADANLSISSGAIQITESYEGLEGQSIDITGGEITLSTSDDGLNAAGGNDQSGMGDRGQGPDNFDVDADAYIHIAGGVIRVNASGDGIDSNGSLTVSGGEVYLSGPDNGGNGTLDYASEATISGGVFVAAGASQMAQNFGSSSTQGVMMVTVSSQQAGSTIRLTDSSGQELLCWEAEKAFDSVLISCPNITEGATYTLTAGSDAVEVTMDSLVYGSNEGGNIPGAMPGGPGGGDMSPGSKGQRPPDRNG